MANFSSILIHHTLLCSTRCSATDLFVATDCSDMPGVFLLCRPPVLMRHSLIMFCRSAPAPAAPAVSVPSCFMCCWQHQPHADSAGGHQLTAAQLFSSRLGNSCGRSASALVPFCVITMISLFLLVLMTFHREALFQPFAVSCSCPSYCSLP